LYHPEVGITHEPDAEMQSTDAAGGWKPYFDAFLSRPETDLIAEGKAQSCRRPAGRWRAVLVGVVFAQVAVVTGEEDPAMELIGPW